MPTSITHVRYFSGVYGWRMMASRKGIAQVLVSNPTHLECKEIRHIAFMFEKVGTHSHTNTLPLTATISVDFMLSASAGNTLHNG